MPFHPAVLDGLWQLRTLGRELTGSDRDDMRGKKVSRKDECPWTVERNEGRLVEIYVHSLESTEEVRAFSQAIYDVAIQTPDAILVVDLRTPVVFPEPVAKAVVELMVRANSVRKKTAVLLSNERAIFAMQLVRLAKQAGDPKRRTFTAPGELVAWLEADLSARERARLRSFVLPRR